MATDESSPGEGSNTTSKLLHLPSLTSQGQACSILTCAVQHLFLAKGQIPDPVSVLQNRRARERLAKSTDGSMMGSRPKAEPYAKRRRARRVDEVLLNIQRLSQGLSFAMQQLQQNFPEERDIHVLIRFGQSRYSCRQQILISLQDVLLLSVREPPLQDVVARRKKLATMEKKLVRFLLALASEDEDFSKLLNTPIGLTRAHVFLLAPKSFTCQGWLKQQSLKMSETFFTDQKKEQSETSGFDEELRCSTQSEDMMPITEMPKADLIVIDEADDIDTKRLKRMQQRALEKQQALAIDSSKSNKKRNRGSGLKSMKRQPLSASFVMQCGKEGAERGDRSLPVDHSWYACRVVLKGVL